MMKTNHSGYFVHCKVVPAVCDLNLETESDTAEVSGVEISKVKIATAIKTIV